MNELEPPPSHISLWNWEWIKWLYNLWEWVRANIMKDVFLEIAKGNVTGHSSVNKFGEANIDTKDETWVIWDGATDDISADPYPYPATALMTSISQTADQSTLRGDSIEIQGLDEDWELVIQNATLDASNTTTVVTLTTPLIRVFRMKVLANTVSTSPIRVHNAGETVDYAIIQTGNNQTLMALYTIPAGKTGYMIDYWASLTIGLNKEPKGASIRLWMADRANSYEFQLKHSRGIQKGGAGFTHPFSPYMKITEKTDIKIEGFVDDNPGKIGAGFNLIIVDN